MYPKDRPVLGWEQSYKPLSTRGLVRFLRYFTVLICLTLLCSCQTVFADNQTGDNVTITAVIKPVRYILINKYGTITEILSNTTQSVKPIVYLDKLNGNQVSFSSNLQRQYISILESINTAKKYGVIYKYQKTNNLNLVRFFKAYIYF